MKRDLESREAKQLHAIAQLVGSKMAFPPRAHLGEGTFALQLPPCACSPSFSPPSSFAAFHVIPTFTTNLGFTYTLKNTTHMSWKHTQCSVHGTLSLSVLFILILASFFS